MLGKDANGGYALRPRDSASWSQRLQPLVSLMQSTLASVGAARFLAMLDRVANPYGMSIAAELSASLSNGARVEIVQDMQLAAEVASTPVVSANEGAQVRLIATPVNQVGAAGHGSTVARTYPRRARAWAFADLAIGRVRRVMLITLPRDRHASNARLLGIGAAVRIRRAMVDCRRVARRIRNKAAQVLVDSGLEIGFATVAARTTLPRDRHVSDAASATALEGKTKCAPRRVDQIPTTSGAATGFVPAVVRTIFHRERNVTSVRAILD